MVFEGCTAPHRSLHGLVLRLRDLREENPRFGTDLSQTLLGVFVSDPGSYIHGLLIVVRLVCSSCFDRTQSSTHIAKVFPFDILIGSKPVPGAARAMGAVRLDLLS